MKYLKFIFIFFIIYILLVLPSFNKPLTTDEVALAEAARVHWSFANLGPGGHPPFYIDILRLLSQLFGIHGGNLRIIGIICFFLNLIIIYKLCDELLENKKAGLLSCLIFALHPMAIQGSILLDIDNTVLTVLLMLTIYYFFKNCQKLVFRNSVFLTLLFFLCLWSKISTPFILMGCLILFYLFKKDASASLKIFLISLASVLLFILIWKIDSAVLRFPFSSLFGRAVGVAGRGASGVTFRAAWELPLRVLRVSLWLGAYTLILIIGIILKRAKAFFSERRQLDFNDFLVFYAFGIFFCYTLIGGLSFSFAKYQYPILPALSIIISSEILSLELKSLKKYLFIYALLAVFLVLINNLVLRDPLYQINYTLRKLSIFYPQLVVVFLRDFILRLVFCLGALFLVAEIARRITRAIGFWRAFYCLSLVFILLSNLFFDFYLRRADFFTTYCYGRNINEFKQAAHLCKNIVVKDKKAKIIAPEDILYFAGIDVFMGYEQLWNNPKEFMKIIKEEKVSAVIYAFTYNAVFSYRNIFLNPQIINALKDKFTLKVLGEYTIWEKK